MQSATSRKKENTTWSQMSIITQKVQIKKKKKKHANF